MSRKELEGIIKKLLGIEYELDDRTSLIKYGGDSLFFGRLQIELKRTFGLKVPIQQLFQNGTIEQLCKVLGIEEHNGEKIDITDLQTAYLYGRKPEMILGGKGSRAYFSFEVEDVDIARLQKAIKNLVEEQEALRCTFHEDQYANVQESQKLEMAWNKVIAKHDMLRAIIYENGYQRVQKDVPEVKIESYDLRTCSEDEQLLNLQNIRANYAEKQYPLGQWPMCDIVLSLWKGKSIIHFSLDMLITDFMSANLILNDLDNYYHGKAVEVKVETLYRDIVLYNQRKSMSKSKERKKAERYWQDKIRNMGTAPELIINNQKTGERETFKQLKFFIDEEGKENINEIAKELRVTASTVILTAFRKKR